MKDVLFNLALIDTLNFCKANYIDPSGSHLEKDGRGYTYSLIRDTDNAKLVTVTFSKNSVPVHSVTNEIREEIKQTITRLRTNAPGYILGELTEYATDDEVMQMRDLNDRKAEIHNRVLSRSKYQERRKA